MSEPKPLTKERRAEIARCFDNERDDDALSIACDELLAAEQYWREAVKNACESSDSGASAGMSYRCNFCNADSRSVQFGCYDDTIDHKPDCPWKLAQSE